MAAAVRIPLYKSNEVLIVQQHELSDDIISILQREGVDFRIWLECARGLLSQGRVEAYKKLLHSLINEIKGFRADPRSKFIHIQALCSLGDLLQQQARLEEDTEIKRQHLVEARNLYFEAVKIDDKEMLPHLGTGDAFLIQVRTLSNY